MAAAIGKHTYYLEFSMSLIFLCILLDWRSNGGEAKTKQQAIFDLAGDGARGRERFFKRLLLLRAPN